MYVKNVGKDRCEVQQKTRLVAGLRVESRELDRFFPAEN
jgi:hypothetical protein